MLKQLSNYADQLDDLAPAGYLQTSVRYVLELDTYGRLLGIVDRAQGTSARERRGKPMLTPTVGRSSGVKPKLLADNGEYVLGVLRDPAKRARAIDAHRSFVDLVRECFRATEEPALRAVLTFLDSWTGEAERLPSAFDPGAVVTFSIDGNLPVELPSVRAFWAQRSEASPESVSATIVETGDRVAQCLVCGHQRRPMKVLTYKWKRIPGGQTSGLALISANAPSFESYGLEQSLVAPTCAACVERFSKAANHLLMSESNSVRVGPVAYIFWAREPARFSMATFFTEPSAEDVRALLRSTSTAQRGAVEPDGAAYDTTPFYAAALSASGSRVVVRDWLDTTLGEAQRHLARYFRLQWIVRPDGSEPQPLKLVALAGATVRELKDLTPEVTKTLLASALSGDPLPRALLFDAMRRCRAANDVNRPAAALIKMVLVSELERQAGRNTMAEAELVQLDLATRNEAYLCGRLLAVLEAVQRAALGDVNATIVDRYFGTASSAPASVFGRLLRGAQPHLSKLRRDRPGAYSALQRRLEEVQQGLTRFPATLTLIDQGRFALGYYHQRAADRSAAAAARAKRDRATASEQEFAAALETPVEPLGA